MPVAHEWQTLFGLWQVLSQLKHSSYKMAISTEYTYRTADHLGCLRSHCSYSLPVNLWSCFLPHFIGLCFTFHCLLAGFFCADSPLLLIWLMDWKVERKVSHVDIFPNSSALFFDTGLMKQNNSALQPLKVSMNGSSTLWTEIDLLYKAIYKMKSRWRLEPLFRGTKQVD